VSLSIPQDSCGLGNPSPPRIVFFSCHVDLRHFDTHTALALRSALFPRCCLVALFSRMLSNHTACPATPKFAENPRFPPWFRLTPLQKPRDLTSISHMAWIFGSYRRNSKYSCTKPDHTENSGYAEALATGTEFAPRPGYNACASAESIIVIRRSFQPRPDWTLHVPDTAQLQQCLSMKKVPSGLGKNMHWNCLRESAADRALISASLAFAAIGLQNASTSTDSWWKCPKRVDPWLSALTPKGLAAAKRPMPSWSAYLKVGFRGRPSWLTLF
jgi:hypothetical protein